MITDESLMLEFQKGSPAAFSELFHRYREPVFGFFRRRLQDAGRAEDLAQETFLGVLRAAERYEPRAAFRCYLYGIAFKLLAAERRRNAREHSSPADPVEGKLTTSPGDPEDSQWAGASVLRQADDPDAALRVRSAIEKLDLEAREVLLLREYEQLSYAEISTTLRLPLNTVRSRLFRARTALKNMLCEAREQR